MGKVTEGAGLLVPRLLKGGPSKPVRHTVEVNPAKGWGLQANQGVDSDYRPCYIPRRAGRLGIPRGAPPGLWRPSACADRIAFRAASVPLRGSPPLGRYPEERPSARDWADVHETGPVVRGDRAALARCRKRGSACQTGVRALAERQQSSCRLLRR